MDDDQVKERSENIGAGVAFGNTLATRCGRCPVRAKDAFLYGGGDPLVVGLGIGLEELGVELREDVFDAGSLVWEGHGEEGFKGG